MPPWPGRLGLAASKHEAVETGVKIGSFEVKTELTWALGTTVLIAETMQAATCAKRLVKMVQTQLTEDDGVCKDELTSQGRLLSSLAGSLGRGPRD